MTTLPPGATIGILGIQYVARASLFLNAIPLLMILVVFFRVQGGISQHQPTLSDNWGAIATILQTVIGFFATAGAAGVDFGMNSRDERDVRLGGLVGIAGAILIAGGLRPGDGEWYCGGLWVMEVTSRARSDELVEGDPHYQLGMRKSYKLFVWGKAPCYGEVVL